MRKLLYLILLFSSSLIAQEYTTYDKENIVGTPNLSIKVFANELNPDGSEAINNSIFCGTDGVLYFKNNTGQVLDLLEDLQGVQWNGQNNWVAYGQLGELGGESSFTYNPVGNILTTDVFQPPTLNNITSQFKAGTNPFTVQSASGGQILNLFTYLNTNSPNGDLREGVFGYRYSDTGIPQANHWFFVAEGASYNDKTLYISDEHISMEANPIINLADPTAAQDAATKAYVDAQVGAGGDGNGIYSGSGTVPANTVATSPQGGFNDAYFQFGVNASGPLNTDDNFPFFGFGHQTSTSNFGKIGFVLEGGFNDPPVLLTDKGRVSERAFSYESVLGNKSEFVNDGDSLRYIFFDGSTSYEYTFPRDLPPTGSEGAWIFDSTGKHVGYSDGRVLKAVKAADETRTNGAAATDTDFQITGIPAGYYQVEMVLKYSSTSTSEGLNWSWFDGTNTTNEARSGYRIISSTNNLRFQWDDLQTEGVQTANVEHQVETIGGTLQVDTDGGLLRCSWGSIGLVDGVTLHKGSYIKLTKYYNE